MKRTDMVVYERVAEDSCGGWCPDIGGAVGAGDRLELARESLSEGMTFQLEDVAERGVRAPLAVSKSVDFSEFDLNPANSHHEIEWLTLDLPEISSNADRHTAQAAA